MTFPATLLDRLAAHPTLSAAAAGFGILTAAYHAVSVLRFLSLYARPSKLRRYLHAADDGRPAWALVTGASDGIGKAFAHELAATGFNVVLHGRNEGKLEGVRDGLARAYPAREFRILIADASAVPCVNCSSSTTTTTTTTTSAHTTTTVDFAHIVASLSDLHLTVLINNAGGGPVRPTFAPLWAFPQDTVVGNISLNAVFPTVLLRHVLPQLQRAGGPALVVNIGSMADNGLPFLSFYGPSKAFLIRCSAVVARELALTGHGNNVEVLGVRVGSVTATTHNVARPSFFEPDARTMARAALARVGCGRSVVVGYLPHALQEASVALMPVSLRDWVFGQVMIKLRADDQAKLKAS